MRFTELTLHPSVMQGIEEAGFTECTPVQEMTFQKSLAGKDVMVQSQTGTGKTAAFLITIFNLFLSDEKYRNRKALILTPTRELAVQVEQDALVLGKYTGLKTGSFYGGVGYVTQDRLLREDLKIPVTECNINREMLYIADEIFFTGTAAEVTPVASVDKIDVGNGGRGPITEKVQTLLLSILQGRSPDKYGWLTLVNK